MNTPSATTRTRAWTTKLASVLALSLAALAIGCGPSPAYEPEPRMPTSPVAYVANASQEPMSSEELAAANEQARLQAGGDIAVGAESDDEYADTDPSALTEFKPALEGHGEWVDDPTYGTLWVPSATEVGTDFVPYSTAGHWTYDDAQDYVWVSDYSWGWAPFHYGRWVRVANHGWAWIPGRRYAGAWVSWRTGDPGYEYVGWAPMGPDWYWYNGYAVGWTFGYTPYWGYCHRDYLWTPGYGGYYYGGYSPRGREMEGRTRPYAPPAGTGGPGRGPDRYAANPSVGGGGRTPASPRIGPSPASLGIKADRIPAPPMGQDSGVARARTFGTPKTAMAAGAAAPVQTRRRPFDRDMTMSDPNRAPGAGAGLGSGRIDAAARAPQYTTPGTGNARSALASPAARPFATSPTITQGSSQPTLRTAPSFQSSPSAGPVQTPSFRSPQASPSMPTSRPMPSSPSTPSFRSSPQVAQPSQPTFRSAPSMAQPSQSMRSAPSTPSFRSAPSQPTFRPSQSTGSVSRPSAPSVSRPSAPVSRPSTTSRGASSPRRR